MQVVAVSLTSENISFALIVYCSKQLFTERSLNHNTPGSLGFSAGPSEQRGQGGDHTPTPLDFGKKEAKTSPIQVNHYEIVVKFAHINHNLTYLAIVHKFTRIYPFCSTYELTKQFM